MIATQKKLNTAVAVSSTEIEIISLTIKTLTLISPLSKKASQTITSESTSTHQHQ